MRYWRMRVMQFRSALPRRERRLVGCAAARLSMFRSALPRRERPRSAASGCQQSKVSIRAPAKGATLGARSLCSSQQSFRSALPRRERPRPIARHADRGSACFDPRSREGSDCRRRRSSTPCFDVSIRAPAKGATCRAVRQACAHRHVSIRAPAKGATRRYATRVQHAPRCFDPRSREGSDGPCRLKRRPRHAFRSALPRRERLARRDSLVAWTACFDPRSREGSD